jgi:uncharacterized protein (TIGR01777 family)
MRIAISGARGLIGGALTARLRELNHDVSPILRVGAPVSATTECRFFDPAGGPACLTALEGTDAVIHLAGHPIGKRRLDAAERSAIYASRVYGTRSLVSGLGELANPPRILLAASASGYYGSRGDELLDETSPPGEGFLAKVVTDWEVEAAKATAFGARVVMLRTGIVLAREGGLLARLWPLFALGLGGRLGNGAQWMSWISLLDEVGAIVHLLSSDVSGSVNLVAPNPVTNAEFTRALAHRLQRPALLSVPRPALEFVLGKELAKELAFTSQRIEPRVLQADGYRFAHATIAEALAAID